MLNDIRKNILMLTDCYNLSHQRLKCNTDWEVSHIYNRKSGQILFGFQEIITNLLNNQITKEMVEEATMQANRMGLIFPTDLFMKVIDECNGYIPLKVQILPEGTWCPKGTPFAQIRNTVEGFGELVTWWEGVIMHAYFPSNCATEAFFMKKYLEEKQGEYGFDDSFLWRFHSFGFRGHKSLEDAYWAGTAWSMFLLGTDDFHVAMHTNENIILGSIPALAHKVTQQFDEEYECFKHSIDEVAGKENIVAMVIDTYDADNVIENYTVPLAEYAKEKGVKIVFRPDSGLVYVQAERIYHKMKDANLLNNTGVIIGESMSFQEAKRADAMFERAGIPLNYINYGIGAGYYKYIERDTLGWAMKTAYSNGAPRMKIVKNEPFKQSIPNIIHLKYDNDKNIVVFDGDSSDTEFITIYDFENSNIKINKIPDKNHFIDVRDRALNQNISQEKILLSMDVFKRISEISKKYI